jgi:hypothetical protein
VAKHHVGEDQYEHELNDGGGEQDAEHGRLLQQDERDDCDRQREREGGPPRPEARKDVSEYLVDDVRHRVREVEEVAERPDRRLHERSAAADGRLDERRQPAGGDDLLAVAQPDGERQGAERGAESARSPAERVSPAPGR